MTSGGTESILSAVKASRDYMRAKRGIRYPEMVIANSAHAAFYKAAEFFNIRLITVRSVGLIDLTMPSRCPSCILRSQLVGFADAPLSLPSLHAPYGHSPLPPPQRPWLGVWPPSTAIAQLRPEPLPGPLPNVNPGPLAHAAEGGPRLPAVRRRGAAGDHAQHSAGRRLVARFPARRHGPRRRHRGGARDDIPLEILKLARL